MTDGIVTDVLAPGGGLARAIPHYEDRPEQRLMSGAIARALREARPLLVEAGTGVGKTLAYLVPAIEEATRTGSKVIVSTGTRSLQDQIARHDLPLLRDLLGRDFTAVVLKGIPNYLCRRKLAEVASAGGRTPTIAALVDWAERTTGGDRAEVDWLGDDDPVWAEVTTTSDARIGARCPYFERCFVTGARRAADKADLVIVNHHLYFADLALRAAAPGARLLPEHMAIIFDEAHQLEDVATEHFAARVSTVRVGQVVRDARLAGAGDLLSRDFGLEPALASVERSALGFFGRVREALLRLGEDAGRVELPPGLFDHGPLQAAWFGLDSALEELARLISDAGGGGPGPPGGATVGDDRDASADVDEGRALALAQAARRARSLRDDLAAIADGRQPAQVYWGELRAGGLVLTAAPLSVAELVRRHVVRAGPTPIFTSATLTTEDRFDFTRARLGLADDEVDALAVSSPFDYATQALLYVPRDLPEPDAASGLCSEPALARMRELLTLTGGRAFVLFTSHRALRDAARRLGATTQHPLLVQGDGPRDLLVERFRATPGAVLCGTGSFWEGVDVPGDALSLVIIDKLPFEPHTDPLVAGRARIVGERGGDAFTELQLPRAALALKQGFGRLIRRKDDRGVVAVLDPRIVTRRYGAAFMATLPAGLARTSALEQVRRWWASTAPTSTTTTTPTPMPTTTDGLPTAPTEVPP